MLISHKRAFLATALRRSGLLRVLEVLARRPGLLVLGYHRIGSLAGNPFYDGVFSATPDDFARQVRHLRDRFRVLTLDQVLAGGPELALREPCVLITFDDGYRDNVDLALPILQDLAVPATFFLPTDFLEQPRLFWWDRLAYILKHNPVANLETEVNACLMAPPDDIPGRLDQLQRRAEIDVPEAELARSLLMDWDGARRLLGSGMTVGSHARSHRNLARLDEANQRDELLGSKAVLEANLGVEISALAYPYGVADAFTDQTCELAIEAGYRLTFGFQGGINRPGRPPRSAISRINVGHADTPDLFRTRAAMLSAFGRSVV